MMMKNLLPDMPKVESITLEFESLRDQSYVWLSDDNDFSRNSLPSIRIFFSSDLRDEACIDAAVAYGIALDTFLGKYLYI